MRARYLPLIAPLILLVPLSVHAQDGTFLGKSAREWVQELERQQSPARCRAAFALGQMGTEAAGAAPALVDVLQHDAEPAVREAAAFALGLIGPTPFDEQVVPALLKALVGGKDSEVQRSAAFALGRHGELRMARNGLLQEKNRAVEVTKALRQALADEHSGTRQNAAWALGQFGEDVTSDAVGALTQLLSDRDALVRRDTALALGKLGRPAQVSVPALIECLKDDDAVVWKTALAALVSVVGPENQSLAPKLRKLLNHSDEEVSRSAALALANIGGKESLAAVPILRQALKDSDDLTRRLAATGLASVGPFATEAVGDLSRALTDPDREVRRGAAVALARIREPARSALPALVKRLTDTSEDDEVRKYAGEAIAAIDPNDAEVLPGLLKVLQEKECWGARQRCIWALSHLNDFRQPGVVEGMTRLLSESGPRAKFLRYESAVTLAVRLKADVPDAVFDVMKEALADTTVMVYTGAGAKVSTGTSESKMGGTEVEDTGTGDWRSEVAKAIRAIGPKAGKRPEIVEGLEKVKKESPDPEAKKAADEALKAIKSK
jgi:HEAT repeat protein